ncbi:MAG TPA: hypothetical protein PKJ47_10115 [Candidatus Limiplasma sp.]|nr:hypothetical protein [Candidatus Limiplasma sp.]
MKLKPQTVILLASLFVIAGIAATMATGLWQTESDKIPRKLTVAEDAENSGQTQPTAEAGSTAQYDPADIRGSYTFGEISNLYGVPLTHIAQAFGLTYAQAEGFQAKTLESRYPDAEQEIGTASVRLFVADYLGLPYTPTEDTWLPKTAADVLGASGHMNADQTAYLQTHTLP